MKFFLFLSFSLLLHANEFAFIKPISVEKAPPLVIVPVKQKLPVVKKIVVEQPSAVDTPLPLDIDEEEPQALALDDTLLADDNISKKDVSNELVKTKLLNITFKPSSAIITSESNDKLIVFADYLLENKSFQVVIYGYTDSIGDAPVNLKLSQKRAKSVTTTLNSLGVSSTRLTAVGMGEKDPIATNETREGRAKNRRIEALIIE